MDIVHELETLNSLKEKGVITEEDFQTQKARLLQENLKPKDEGASMKEAYVSYWKHSFKWRGRATRSEFWWPVLVNFLIGIGFSIIGGFLPFFSLLYLLFAIVTIFPSLSVCVRRYHDLGHSGWFAFIPTFIILGIGTVAIVDMIVNYMGGGLFPAFKVIYIVGGFVLVPIIIVWGYVFPCLPGQKEANKYGEPR